MNAPQAHRRTSFAPVFFSLLVSLLSLVSAPAETTVWQWSVPVGAGRAYLWIPEDCTRLRGLILAQHNMIERGILEHPAMRRTLAELGLAEVFIVPSVDPVYRFDQGAQELFDGVLHALAAESGYAELATVPVAPMGHSAHASFPWNYAAAHPGRTLAALSLKGDAPLTNLTGSGRPNPDWGDRTLAGIPGLFVMSEQEWWEERLAPLLRFRETHPATPLAVLCDTGHGHFDATDELVAFLAMFLRKAAEARLPGGMDLRSMSPDPGRRPGPMLPIDPAAGWLVDRWRGEEPPRAPPAAFADYRGDRREALWCFDEEMARATEARHAAGRGQRKQQVSFREDDAWVPMSNTHAGVELTFLPGADGLTFRLDAGCVAPLPPHPPVATKDARPPVVTVTPSPAAPGTHAPGPVEVSRIIGPVAAVSPGVFRVALDRMYSPADPRTHEAWFLARHPGDGGFKGAVQQARLRLPAFAEGAEQTITFPRIPDQTLGTATVALAATSSSGAPVSYYVREGPAFVRDGQLHLTSLPPRAKLPVKVTVVAWQFGRGAEPKLCAATPVERSFLILPRP